MKSFSDPDSNYSSVNNVGSITVNYFNKSESKYGCLSKSDSMWFCLKFTEIVEKNIAVDLKIEERCRQIMLNYELRISQLEDYMKDECNEAPIREIVQEELKSGEESRNSDNEGQVTYKKFKTTRTREVCVNRAE